MKCYIKQMRHDVEPTVQTMTSKIFHDCNSCSERQFPVVMIFSAAEGKKETDCKFRKEEEETYRRVLCVRDPLGPVKTLTTHDTLACLQRLMLK